MYYTMNAERGVGMREERKERRAKKLVNKEVLDGAAWIENHENIDAIISYNDGSCGLVLRTFHCFLAYGQWLMSCHIEGCNFTLNKVLRAVTDCHLRYEAKEFRHLPGTTVNSQKQPHLILTQFQSCLILRSLHWITGSLKYKRVTLLRSEIDLWDTQTLRFCVTEITSLLRCKDHLV